ncbi:MAG: hypothetical protein RL291_134 [Pseudomonadota bacterium]
MQDPSQGAANDTAPDSNAGAASGAAAPRLVTIEEVVATIDLRSKACEQVARMCADGLIDLKSDNRHAEMLELAELHASWLAGYLVDEVYPPTDAETPAGDADADADDLPQPKAA